MAQARLSQPNAAMESLPSYWKNPLNETFSLFILPHEHDLLYTTSCQESQISFSFSKSDTDSLNQLSRQSGSSLFALLLAAFKTLLYRYTNKEDISISYPSFTDMVNGKGELIGRGNNTELPRTDFSGNPDFVELLKRVSQAVSELNVHTDSSNETLTDTRRAENGFGNAKPYNILFSFRNTTNGLRESSVQLNSLIADIDLGLFIEDASCGLSGVFTYNAQVFHSDFVTQMGKHFQILLQATVANPRQLISQLPLLTEEEQYKLLFVWNNSHVNYPADTCIHQLFEEQVVKTPGATAVVFGKKQLTYKQLNEHSNKLAHYLKTKGVKEETLVPVCLGRSVEMIVSILGILKAGGAYVPIDPDYPAERIKYMLEDTKATLVVSDKESKLKLQTAKDIDIIQLDDEFKNIQTQPVNNPELTLTAHSLAYVIYTSGSTGLPKGVMIEHSALIDHCYGVIKSADLNRCASFALFSPLVFDAGHSIIHSAFLLGASLHVLSKELITDGEKLSHYLKYNSIDCIKIVPSLWLSYANANNIVLSNKIMIFGGEAFSISILNYLAKLHYSGDVFNHYGPTETTIGKCIHKVDLNIQYKTVPIGKPFSNTQLYVLDQYHQLVPVGVEGELHIGGEGLARQYLNQPELTAEKFIKNPFSTRKGSKVYRTGDKVRWLADGNIEYLGRIDEQVKIRGYRIELGEIEHVLLKSKLVNQGVIIASKDRQGNNSLVGYVVTEKPFNREALKEYLRRKLPEYMVPAIWIELKSLPLTRNGKIDKKGLPDPDSVEFVNDKYVAPRNKLEATLVKIFQDVLKIKRIGIHDNFFELGGDSVQAVVLFYKIRKACGGKQLPLATLFENATIERLAVFLSKQGKAELSKSSLVSIKPYGSKPPLFCIHAGAGTVLFYRELAEYLGADQPVYGLQAKGLNGNETPHTKIEDMAVHYIKEIKTFQSKGPYFLAGYCLGGIIAFEMAQQFKQLGDEVALLATINSRSPIYVDPAIPSNKKENGDLSRSHKVAYHLKQLAKLSTKEKLLYPLKRFNHKIGYYIFLTRIFFYKYYISRNLPLPQILGRNFFLETNTGMANAYKPKKYDGRMIVFRSPQIYPVLHSGWGDLVTGEIKTIDIAGNHPDRRAILEEPFVQLLAQELKGIISTLEAKTV